MPSVPVMSADKAGLVQDFSDEDLLPDSSQKKNEKSSLIPSSDEQITFNKRTFLDINRENNPGEKFSANELTYKNKVPIQPDIPRQIQAVTGKNRYGSDDSQNTNVTPYIMRHVERMIVKKKKKNIDTSHIPDSANNNTGPNGKHEYFPENISEKNILSKANEAKDSSLLNTRESDDHMDDTGKKESNSRPEIKFTNTSLDNKTISPSILPRMNPVQPAVEISSQARNRNNPPSPKLVIGKITVEILPPVAQPATKIITRVVQPPSTENYPKMNRLNFGLGQL